MKKINYIILLCCIFFVEPNSVLSQFVPTSGPNGGAVQFLFADGNNLFAGTHTGGMFVTTNSGDSWTAINNGLTNLDIMDMCKMGSELFIATHFGGIFKSTNNGNSWIAVNNGFPTLAFFCVATNGTYLLAGNAEGYGAFKSTNSGNSWTNFPIVVDSNSNVYTSFFMQGNMILAAMQGRRPIRSTNSGLSWVHFGDLQMQGSTWKFTLINGIIYANSANSLWYSTDNGNTWPNFNGLWGNNHGIVVINNYMLTGLWNGVHISTDNGLTWIYPNSDYMYGYFIYSMANNSTYVFAGTNTNVWRNSISSLAVEQISSSVPDAYSLVQNYPNPFNPATNIEFRIVNYGFVSVKVYDMLGNEVAVLVNEELGPGTYKAKWEAGDYSSGVYYYKILTANFTDTKKMILVK